MQKPMVAYAATAGLLLVLDAVWLGLVAKPVYTAAIGHLMAEQPNLPAALLFYLLYPIGLVLFAVLPQAGDAGWRTAALGGGLFGFFAYATYDLTNLATLESWPVGVSLLDMAWGTALSAASATAGKLALDRWARLAADQPPPPRGAAAAAARTDHDQGSPR
jgi:uncharacterized membrane protein